ncbi:tyrosine-type recombinase/integrase [Pseudooceanicola spongiae]|uniref:Tyrosine-type recombinase/integrase n=1 Tax=Pseudooceanicola spongiae TaxID=2613965 RepID=A0A7L9WLQ8_9RHOB|nr:tyrosine-type recombinase/integrase [Pseudooceanicola spongiae]QOL80458.1 tyrosine-type recombinase/integrase [Pseudooceanicola spongiae]
MTKLPQKPRLEWKMVRGVITPRHRASYTVNGKRRERVVTLDWQDDPQELDRLYWLCERGNHPIQKPKPPATSWRVLVEAWRKDPIKQKSLSDETKRSYRRTMDALLEKNESKDVSKTTRQHVRAIQARLADTPRKADHTIQVIRMLWNYAKKTLDWPLGENPAAEIKLFGPQRELPAWPEWMVKALPTAPADVRTTSELILGTGQRPNAAINMRRDQFDGESMIVWDEKGDVAHDVFCPPRLAAFVKGLPIEGQHLLAKNLTQPKGYDSVEKQFRSWRKTLGDKAAPYSLHGLRKLAIVQLAEAGCSDAEIQAVTGQSAQMVAFYRAKASKKRLSRAAQNRRDQNKNGT